MSCEDDRRGLQRETELQMARRHLRDCRARVARQEAIVLEMETTSSSRAADLGRELLEIMRTAVQLAERHVRRLEGELSR